MSLFWPRHRWCKDLGVQMKDEGEAVSREKENVNFLGIQRVPRGGAIVLVNNEMGSTVAFDPKRHNIINADGYVRFVIGSIVGRNG